MTLLSGQARGRWSVAVRTIAGTLGAYGLASRVTVALSLLLTWIGMDRVEAVTAATLVSFAIFAAIAMAAFHAGSAAQAWAWLVMFAVPIDLTVLFMMPGAKG